MAKCPDAHISRIKWGILSDDAWLRRSVLSVTSSKPAPLAPGSVTDPRLGTNSNSVRCTQCQNTVEFCTGHFGHLDLPLPVINYTFYDHVARLVRSFCYACSHVLIPERRIKDVLRLPAERRLKEVSDAAERYCPDPECGCLQPVYLTPKGSNVILAEGAPGTWTPRDLFDSLAFIEPEYAELLGMNFELAHPKNMMFLSAYPIPGLQLRPPNASGIKGDDLTHRYRTIVAAARRLAESNVDAVSLVKGADSPETALYLALADAVAGVVDNSLYAKITKRVFGTPKDCLLDRINGPTSKESSVRRALGKRLEKTARCVIVPDPDLTIDQVGVPMDHAKIILIPERVTEWSISRAYALVRNGSARYLVTQDGRRRDLNSMERNAVVLMPGYLIERQLQNGDVAIYVRQPSLHKHSALAMEVVLQPGNVFGFNQCNCPGYNADFDGDEMTLFFVLSEEARAEARTLARPSQNILKNGAPIVKFVQHTLVSLYAIGFEESLSYSQVSRFYGAPCPRKSYTGREAFSLVLPKSLTLVRGELSIKNGVWVSGLINGDAVNGRDGIIATIVLDLGQAAAARFIHEGCQFLKEYCNSRGFSFHRSDYTFERPFVPTTEAQRLEMAGAARAAAAKEKGNNFILITRSGAKGNEHNLAQMSVALGPTCEAVSSIIGLDGVPNGGFVSSCFSEGLTARDVMTHQIGASFGMASTAYATPKSGYIFKMLVQGLKGLTARIDYSVRDVCGQIVQHTYGDDGYNPNYLSSSPLDLTLTCGATEAETEHLRALAAQLARVPPEWTRETLSPVNFARLATKWAAPVPSTVAPEALFERATAWWRGVFVPKPLKIEWLVAQWTRVEVLRTVDVDAYLADAERLFYRGLVEYGDPVGIVASQDMGECTTQNTLNEFRQKSTASTGIPRLFELLHAAWSSSSVIHTTVALREHVKPHEFIRDVVHVTLRDLFEDTVGARVILNRERCVGYMITPAEIAAQLPEACDCALADDPEYFIEVRPSDLSKTVSQFCNIVVDAAAVTRELERMLPVSTEFEATRKNTILVKIPCTTKGVSVVSILEIIGGARVELKTTHKFIDTAGTTIARGKNFTRLDDAPEGAYFVVTVRFEAGSANTRWINENPELVAGATAVYLDEMLDVTIRGARGVTEGVIDYEGRVILTSGWKTLNKLLVHPMVDSVHTRCNSPPEVDWALGIACARETLLRELTAVFGHRPTSIQARHMALLADQMCVTGRIAAFTFSGFSESNQSYLSRASFERPATVLTEAGALGVTDATDGPVESLIVNGVPNMGTGAVTLLTVPSGPGVVPPPVVFPPLAEPGDVSWFLTPRHPVVPRVWESVFSFSRPSALFEPFA